MGWSSINRKPMTRARAWAVTALIVAAPLVSLFAGAAQSAPAAVDRGESIYLLGLLGSGAPLEASRRPSGLRVTGADAACVNCHQRSGLGSYEGYAGYVRIPPIAGQYLFHARGATSAEPVLPYVESMHSNRDPYTDATLARAIRDGVDSQGRPLNELMPRYTMTDADMSALIAYLKSLDKLQAPGAKEAVLHIATVVTPEADPARRAAMLDVMQHYFADKNEFPIGPSAQMRTSGKTGYAKSMFMPHHQWKLHVWDLSGPPSQWREQLEAHLGQEPVLAVLSGLGGMNWVPVHDFCEQHKLPCLFPNIDVPVNQDHDFYTLYFSRGVLLEAELIGRALSGSDAAGTPRTVYQLYRQGDSGEAAAAVLAAALKEHGINVRTESLGGIRAGKDLSEALHRVSGASALVMWLRPDDLRVLDQPPAPGVSVFVSGLMGGLEHSPLPESWRSRTQMAYPYDLPERRNLRMRYPLAWFSMRHIPIVDERLQADTYLACGLLAETLSHMADNLAQPYIVELLQNSVEHRLINTGYYPRLGLGPNQQFVSKGGYIVHFAEPAGSDLVAD